MGVIGVGMGKLMSRGSPLIWHCRQSFPLQRGFCGLARSQLSPPKKFFQSNLPQTLRFSTLAKEAIPAIPWRQKVVGAWMGFSASLVFGIVVVGGLTRLTESGLSIVEWKPLSGALPPLNQADWEEEFEKYKKSPEFKINNFDMKLDDFKKIFWMEWGHRQLGRFIGLEFLLPAIFFVSRGWVNRTTTIRIAGITALIGFQGLIGWLMVKSGLDDRIVHEQEVPRVNHFRLATHLGTALMIYAGMVWTALDLFSKPQSAELLRSPAIAPFKSLSAVTLGLVATTALSGALVAGLDAGLVYNEFPLMGGKIIPSDLLSMKPTWKNFLYNPTAVQFDHRYLAITTGTVIGGLFLYSRRLALPPVTRLAANHLAAMASIQILLGISTLVYFVPIPVASAHQGGSVFLLTFALWLLHTMKVIPK